MSDEQQEPTAGELERERRAVRRAGSRLPKERAFGGADAVRALLRFVGLWLLLVTLSLLGWQILHR